MKKLPWMKFYHGDWLKDPLLRCVSSAARGLWIDMLSLMCECARRGYLQLPTGQPMTAEHVSRMTGVSTDEVVRLLRELEDSGVFSRLENGTIYSRRIVRDESKKVKCSEAGKKGGGSPTFKGQPKGTSKGEHKGDDKGSTKGQEERSQMSDTRKEIPPTSPPVGDGIEIPEVLKKAPGFLEAWGKWVPFRMKLKSCKDFKMMFREQLLKLSQDPNNAADVINMSVMNGWQGLFPKERTNAVQQQPKKEKIHGL